MRKTNLAVLAVTAICGAVGFSLGVVSANANHATEVGHVPAFRNGKMKLASLEEENKTTGKDIAVNFMATSNQWSNDFWANIYHQHKTMFSNTVDIYRINNAHYGEGKYLKADGDRKGVSWRYISGWRKTFWGDDFSSFYIDKDTGAFYNKNGGYCIGVKNGELKENAEAQSLSGNPYSPSNCMKFKFLDEYDYRHGGKPTTLTERNLLILERGKRVKRDVMIMTDTSPSYCLKLRDGLWTKQVVYGSCELWTTDMWQLNPPEASKRQQYLVD